MADRPTHPFRLTPGVRIIDGQPLYSAAWIDSDTADPITKVIADHHAQAEREIQQVIDDHYERAAREIRESAERVLLRIEFEKAVVLLRRCLTYLPDNCSVEFDVLAFLGSLDEGEGE